MDNFAVGRYGETLAANFLKRRGYQIVERNIKTSYKEIDLVATINDRLVFVEVKTRTSLTMGEASEMMSHRKIKNLKFAIAHYLNNKKIKYQKIRLDFIAVDINRINKIAKIKHFKDIF